MPADGTQIKQNIDNNLAGKGYRGVRVFNIITALKAVVDWVTTSINGNLTTWLRTDNNQPGGANGDGVYRTGKVEFRGGASGLTTQNNTLPLAQQTFDLKGGLEVRGGANQNAAFIDFHLPGFLIHQFGVDTDGRLKLHPWSTNVSHEIVANGYSDKIVTNSNLGNKKLVLYDFNNNDNQFYGLGVQGGQMRYQIPTITDAHIFYAGNSPVTSAELMRITGNGRVGIMTPPASNTILDVGGQGWSNFHGNVGGGFTPGNGIGINLGWNYSSGQAENTLAYGVQGFPSSYFNICSWDGVSMSERMRIDGSGNMGIGSNSPSSKLQVNGVAGHNQFRLEKSYTPANSNDANGQLGQIAWDNNYLYVKGPAGTGWRRTALSNF